MPKSKKPRHTKRPKMLTNLWAIKRSLLDDLHEHFTNLELRIELLLNQGKCTQQDLQNLLTAVNWALVAVSTRNWYTTETRLEASKMLQSAGETIANVYQRSKVNDSDVVCYAQELDLIRDAAEFTMNLLHESLEQVPTRTLKEWDASLECSRNAEFGKPAKTAVKKIQQLMHS